MTISTTHGKGTEWIPSSPPDIPQGRTTGRLQSCSWCGSMHPADVAEAIRAGAVGNFADRKYGWPHKVYFDGIPNPHAGMLECRHSTSNPPQEEIDAGKWVQVPTGLFDRNTGQPTFRWYAAGKPAPATTYGKFYTEHLKDASAEDRDTIERHLGLHVEFRDDGRVQWWPYGTEKPEVPA